MTTAADTTLLRGQLHRELRRRSLPTQADEDDVERLLLAFEELTSNGLRHGAPPVSVSVSQGNSGWLIAVSDGATERTPTPAVDRDPAHGGLGPYLVARLSAAYGWCTGTGRKEVWACVRTAAAA
ncbi:ATP-binding protein [Geodermatophilus normandii]|uniref:ATP-binding protein n=1 Tax=Geodermatophilus normandii TaxID=1137989 RepID=A0A6P0GGH4_9ACTN|nr:ATP-binding protein [Geodermatophilus normandii]